MSEETYDTKDEVPEKYREIVEKLERIQERFDADSAKLRDVEDGREIVLFYED